MRQSAAPTVTAFVKTGLTLPLGLPLAISAAGDLFVANTASNTISQVTPGGTVSTFVGGSQGLNYPDGLAFDRQGNLYVANKLSDTITKVTPGGAVSTFVSAAEGLVKPDGLAFDAQGNLYVANWCNNTIDEVTPGGAVSTFVAASAGLLRPEGLAFDAQGNLYVANYGNSTISKVTPGGAVSTFVATSTGLASPAGLAFDSQGNLYVANEGNGTISKVAPAGAVCTFVNACAGLALPVGLVFDAQGDLYAANWGNDTISKIGLPSGPVCEGQAFSNQAVFHFTDANAGAAASNFTAVVTLGDGKHVTLTGAPGVNGQIVADAGGGFDVQLSYTYAEALRSATFGVRVCDTGGSTCAASTSTFAVADVPLTAAAGKAVSAVKGVSTGAVTVATFVDAGNPSSTADADYGATVNWGDGTTADLLDATHFAWDPVHKVWDVNGSHTYAKAGGYTITVTVNDGPGNSVTVKPAASVATRSLTVPVTVASLGAGGAATAMPAATVNSLVCQTGTSSIAAAGTTLNVSGLPLGAADVNEGPGPASTWIASLPAGKKADTSVNDAALLSILQGPQGSASQKILDPSAVDAFYGPNRR